MAQNKTLELSIKIAGKVDKSLTTAINQTNTLMGSLTTTMSKVGTAGLAAMGALATATVAGLAKCTSEAAKLENNMSAMVRYVDGLTESATTSTEQAQSNLKAMRTYIQDLSTQIPRTTEQISKMSAALGQSGIGADRQMSTGILRDTAVAATAMDLEDDTAGNYMAKWEAAFNFNHDQVMTLMDQINYLGANNATTAAEIAQSVNQAASMGQIAGVDPSATAAIATAMQATGVATDRVGTSISRIYTNISKGSNATKAQKAMWEELGFTAEGIARSMQSDGIGTLKSVFQAINNMPDERKVAALNTLFGQWAIEGGAKITQNLALLEKTLGEVNDPGIYTGSMEREFLIEASTPEAVDLMLSNAKAALMQDIGQAFLPAKKEFSLSMIDFLNQIRKNMPELTTLANSLGKIASDGVERLGDAMERALPYIQRGLDYLANNGPQVASTLGKLAAVFVGMKFAPGIYREIKRGKTVQRTTELIDREIYCPDVAENKYRANLAAKGPALKLGNDYKLAAYIEQKIVEERYSPEAVLLKIKEERLTFSVTLSKWTLYSYITKGVFLGVTNKNLPRKGKKKNKGYRKVRAAHLPQGDSIEDRPEEIAERAMPGDWEMDTVVSCKKDAARLLVLTERMFRQEIIIKMPDGTTQSVVRSLDRLERKLGSRLFRRIFRTITVDNGSEFADCEGMERSCLTKRARTHIYYCHPYSAFERGSNENANILIRRWLPKGTKLSEVSQAEIKQIQIWMNNYPRMVLGGRCANTALTEWMAAEGVLLPLVHI